jgi:hypothetical protein
MREFRVRMDTKYEFCVEMFTYIFLHLDILVERNSVFFESKYNIFIKIYVPT